LIVRFVKMSGAGNDFVVIESAVAQELASDLERWTRHVCRRGLSVGADGLLIVERLGASEAAVRFLNPDGSAAFCGNGSRCAARYAAQQYGFEEGVEFVLQTSAGALPATVEGHRVRLQLAVPVERGTFVLKFDGGEYDARLIDAGTPHLTVQVEDATRFPLSSFGPRFRADDRFGTAGVNVNVWSRKGSELRLRTWEKGVEGETLACGSGAIAAALAARLEFDGDSFRIMPVSGIPIDVRFETAERISFEGAARRIFDGELSVEAIDW
jgi:diaminopimelate epimerase